MLNDVGYEVKVSAVSLSQLNVNKNNPVAISSGGAYYYQNGQPQTLGKSNGLLIITKKDNDNFKGGLIHKDNLYQLTNSNGGGAEDYYIIKQGLRVDSTFCNAFQEILSLCYNSIAAKDNGYKSYQVFWYFKERLYKIRHSSSRYPFLTLPGLKTHNVSGMGAYGNGFFFEAGLYDGGKRDTNDEHYALISWSNADSIKTTGNVEVSGKGGDILAWVKGKIQTEAGVGVNEKRYFLIQVNKRKSWGYDYVYGNKHELVSLNNLLQFLGNSSNNIDLSTSGTNGSWTSSGDKLDFTPTINSITGLPTKSTAQIEYIKDFQNYTLQFKAGKDKRSSQQDPFIDINDKFKGSSEEQLILKVNISDSQVSQISNNMTLSDRYYLYCKIGTENLNDQKEFFKQIDEVLRLNLDSNWENNDFWLDNDKKPTSIPPISNNKRELLPKTAVAISKTDYKKLLNEKNIGTERNNAIYLKDLGPYSKYSLQDFFLGTAQENNNIKNRTDYKLLIFDIKDKQEENFPQVVNYSFSTFLDEISYYTIYKNKKGYSITVSFNQERKAINLYSLQLLEAYTRGQDFIQENYTTVRPQEIDFNENRIMSKDDNYFVYKYSGRDFDIMRKRDEKNTVFTFYNNSTYGALVHECDLLLETDVTLGDSYGRNNYFIEYIKYPKGTSYNYKDTFKITDYVKAVDATKYVEEDLEIITSKIDLTQCEFYDPTAAKFENGWCDCKFGTGDEYKKECVYQKLGYCPYRFTTEKHPRRIRTLSQEKSNRFNLIQELSKVFKIYPQFYIEFDSNGKIILDESGRMKKHVFFMTEKGNKNQLGFRYEKNLSGISRDVNSTSLTTKLFVENVDSELSKTGLCSIQTAEDNISKTSYLLDFSYYTKMNILNEEQVIKDLYGINKGDFSFLPTIGYYNTQYDKLTNLIVNLTGETMVKLQAENDTYIQGVTTALEERQKIAQKMYQFKVKNIEKGVIDYTTSDSYKNYLAKMKEQSTILWGLIETLFFTNDYCNIFYSLDELSDDIFSAKNVKINTISDTIIGNADITEMINTHCNQYCKGELFWRLNIEGFKDIDNATQKDKDYKPALSSWLDFKEKIIDTKKYAVNGVIGQYNKMFEQVKKWKTERAKWLNKINDISEIFYKKYEPFIKEGTWTDSNYLTDNEYYWAANSVLNDSNQPKISYNLSVVDLSPLDEDYKFELADTSFIEDIDFFGINNKTGLPNQEKVLVSGLTYDLDIPSNDSIEVRNYTSSFDELFQSISASVQSLTFNENTYKRAANFTATKYIEKESLQGALFDGDLTLVDAYSENVVIDDKGVEGKNIGNEALQYRLDGEGLAFSRDNGQTYDIGVGPNGINADYIKFGQLDASKIQIVDGNYIYFLWDKDGLNAYRNPSTSTNGLVDFARFNRYGLSLIENNNIRLRAGYEFKNNSVRNFSGNYNTELDLADQNIGFYLYNDSGQAIFKTETRSSYKTSDDSDYSARLSLTGEMFITNRVLEGENDGSVVSRTKELQLQGSWKMFQHNIPILYAQPLWFNLIQQFKINWNGNYGVEDDGNNKIPINWNFATKDNTAPVFSENNTKVTFEPALTNGVLENETKIIYVYTLMKEPSLINNVLDYTYDPITKMVKKENMELFSKSRYFYTMYSIILRQQEFEVSEEKITISIETLKEKIKNNDPNEIKITTSYIDLYAEYMEAEKVNLLAMYTTINQQLTFNDGSDPLETTNTTGTVTQETVKFYDVAKLKVGESVPEQEAILYAYTYGTSGGESNYWSSSTETGKYVPLVTSDLKTEEVGIFINNKMGVNEESASISTDENLQQSEDNNDKKEETPPEETPPEETPPEEITPEETVLKKATLKEVSSEGAPSETLSLSTSNGSSAINILDPNFVLIGDSITEGLHNATDLKDNAFGVGSMNLTHASKFSGLSQLSGKKIAAYFMGMNHVYSDNYKELYIDFINETLGYLNNTKNDIEQVYVVSITAVDETIGGYTRTNEDIEKCNAAIKELVGQEVTFGDKKISIAKYIDVYADSKNYSHSDMVHFDVNGSKQLFDRLKALFGETSSSSSSNNSTVNVDEGAAAAADTALGGAERIFTIALKGATENNKTEYKNILTVLKNGYLYLGGTITDYYGHDLLISNFSLIPDKIRIASPQLILSNTGYMWFDFHKTFPIENGELVTNKSLMDLINMGGGGSSSGSGSSTTGTGLPAGYYLIDPLGD